ncbi:MAG: hypothetical protein RMM31_02465 [Anaerolineae bacterium]|nr:hypothetical protein [Thermoflexales bacterium]MDW8395085.1 hypothetical protein [Anaerolineae bacterium]
MRYLKITATLALIGALLFSSHAVAQRGDWEIVPSVLLPFDGRQWQIDSAYNQLVSKSFPGCALAQNVGRGIPVDWTKREERLTRSTRQMVRTTYRDAQSRVQFAVYRYIRPTNLGYLNGEGVLLLPPTNPSQWNACRNAAEQVLAGARRVGG